MLENRTAAHQSDPLQFNSVGCLPILGGSHSLLPNVSPCQSVDITPRHSIAQHVSPSTAHGEGPMAGSNILVRWRLLFTSGVWSNQWATRKCQLGKQGQTAQTADALERHLLPISLDNKKKSVRTFPSDAHLKGGQQKVSARCCTTASSDRCLYMQGPLKNIDTYLSSNIRESCSSATPFWSGFLVRCILPVLRVTLETLAPGYHLPGSKTVVPWCLKLKICQLRR